MKKLTPLLLTLGLGASTAFADFTAGNVVVLQCVHTSTGGAGTLVEFNRVSGPTGFTVALPSASGSDSGTSIVFGQSSTLNHDVTLSDDGAFVVLGGYAYSTTGVDSATLPRVMALVKYDGTYSRTVSTSNGWSVRGAASDGFGNYWIMTGTGGSGGGLPYMGLGPYTLVQSTVGRATAVVGGNLYYTIGDGVHAYTGAPTTTVGAGGLIIPWSAMGAVGTANSGGFAIPPNPTVGAIAYLVDYNTTALGIGHFHYDGSSWVWDYNVQLSSGTLKPQHIAVDYSNPAIPILYVTPTAGSANSLFAIVDSGSGTYSQSTVATAPSGQAFRGLTMAPTAPATPVWVTPPTGQTNFYGATVSFGPVAATGANPNGYTWTRYGTNLVDGPTRPGGAVISGANSNILTVAGIAFDDQTFYYAVAHNNGPSSATSSGAYLRLLGSCINPNLTPATLCAGSTAHFNGGTSGCLPPLQISWSWNAGFGDYAVNDGPGFSGSSTISGSGTANLTIANVQVGDAGTYTLRVIDGNSDPSVSSAALVVADPISISGQPANQTKVAGQTATFTVTVPGAATVYQWKKNGSAISDGTTPTGSTRGGTHTATLGITNVQGGDEGTYICTVSNVCGTALDSDPATLTVGYPPVFTNPPVSLMATAGLTATLIGQASGTATITYSWKHNADALSNDGHYSGTDTDTLGIDNVQAVDAQTYTVTAVNDYGSASASAVVKVVIAQPKSHTVPGLVIYEPFNYPVQAYPGFPAPSGWINSWQDVISAWNEVTGQAAFWERNSQAYCTIENSTYGNDALINSGKYPWGGINCSVTTDWYWSSAPNNNHLNFGGIDQTNGSAYFSFVLQITQGSPLTANKYDIIAGLTSGTGGPNADNWVYKLCTHSSNGGDSYQLGVFKGGGTTIDGTSVNGEWLARDLGRGSVHFVVGCYKFLHGTNLVSGVLTNDDIVSLWVDPDRSTYGVPEVSRPTPDAGGMITNWNANAPITEFALKGLVEPASKRMTDLRIGTTWASVTQPYYPKLTITTTPTDVTVGWPAKDSPYNGFNAHYYGYYLQSAPDLVSWANDYNSMVMDASGTNWNVTESLNAPQFFRLVLP
jgi:hypothetical protein